MKLSWHWVGVFLFGFSFFPFPSKFFVGIFSNLDMNDTMLGKTNQGRRTLRDEEH